MTPTDEKILCIQQDLLRIQSNLFRLMTDVESLAADINRALASATVPPAPGPPNSPGSFEQDIFIYGQRCAAIRLLEFAVNAGALLPRDALGFTIEQDPSEHPRPDILSWTCSSPRWDKLKIVHPVLTIVETYLKCPTMSSW
eukprot:scaffold46041_cov57-Attheya_sp.AAC.4